MRNSSFRLPVVAVFALMLVALSASPAAAATVSGEGYYSRFGFGAGRGGLAIVDYIDTDEGRVRASVEGLLASEEYFIAGRSIGCNGTPSQSNRVFRLTTMTNGEGDLWVNRSVVIKEVLVSSIWIGRTVGSAAPACRAAVHFETRNVATGDVNGDGAAGVIDGTSNTLMGLVEKRPNGQARVSIVVDPHDPNDIYVVSLANRACGHTPTKTFKVQLDGAGYSVHDIHMNQGSLNALRSVRVRNISEGVNVGCAPLSVLIALLLP